MKYGVIDIGSNSVRLMLSENGVTIYKIAKITALAKDMGEELLLKKEAIETTFSVVSFFIDKAKNDGANKILCFATAAVRNAKNKEYFKSEFLSRFNIELDVISGETEAEIGLLGALKGRNGGIIDVGGASTEVIVSKNNTVLYKKSIKCGCVSVTDVCGQDLLYLEDYCAKAVSEFGDVPSSTFYGIGGTATSIASMLLQLDVYDSKRVNGCVVTYENVVKLQNTVLSTPVEKRAEIVGLQKGRERVIGAGITIIKKLMERLKINEMTVSEDDNLEGYLIRLKNEQKN